MIAAGAWVHVLRFTEPSFEAEPRFDVVPRQVAEYVSVQEGLAPRVEEALGADATLMRTYRDGTGLPLWIFMGYHGALKTGRQAHSPKHCYPGAGWDIVDDETVEKSLLGRRLPMSRLVVDNQGARQLVLYWFETGGRPVSDVMGLKWYAVVNGLRRMRTDAGFIRLSTPVGPDGVGAAERRLERFLEALGPSLVRAMPFRDVAVGPGTAEAAS